MAGVARPLVDLAPQFLWSLLLTMRLPFRVQHGEAVGRFEIDDPLVNTARAREFWIELSGGPATPRDAVREELRVCLGRRLARGRAKGVTDPRPPGPPVPLKSPLVASVRRRSGLQGLPSRRSRSGASSKS